MCQRIHSSLIFRRCCSALKWPQNIFIPASSVLLSGPVSTGLLSFATAFDSSLPAPTDSVDNFSSSCPEDALVDLSFDKGGD